MSIDISHFRQKTAKVRLSTAAFDELLGMTNIIASSHQGSRFDAAPAHLNPLHAPNLNAEFNNIRSMVDHGNHVLILDGFNVDNVASFKWLVWTFGSLLGVPMVQNHLGHKVI